MINIFVPNYRKRCKWNTTGTGANKNDAAEEEGFGLLRSCYGHFSCRSFWMILVCSIAVGRILLQVDFQSTWDLFDLQVVEKKNIVTTTSDNKNTTFPNVDINIEPELIQQDNEMDEEEEDPQQKNVDNAEEEEERDGTWNQNFPALETDITWVPIPESLQSAWNASRKVPPLHHCTLGGCRQGNAEISSILPMLEPSRNSSNGGPLRGGLAILLNELQASKPTTTSNDNDDDHVCMLWFVGDSTGSDTAVAAVCTLLSDMPYQLVRCKNDVIGANLYGSDQSYCHDHNLTDPQLELIMTPANTAYFDLEREEGTVGQISCPKLRIKFTFGSYVNSLEKAELVKKAALPDEYGLVLPGWGVHCNVKGCMREFMKKSFQPLFSTLSSPSHRFLWREHEPQHFTNSKGGIFRGGRGPNDTACGPVPNGAFDNYRNEEAEAFLASNNLLGKGEHQVHGIVRIFDALKPMWGFHNNGDCTHYCFSPWRLELTWDGIYQALKGSI